MLMHLRRLLPLSLAISLAACGSGQLQGNVISSAGQSSSSPSVPTGMVTSEVDYRGNERRFLSSKVCLYSPMSMIISLKLLLNLLTHFVPLKSNYKPLHPTKQKFYPPKLWITFRQVF
jgi:hypothetical protein